MFQLLVDGNIDRFLERHDDYVCTQNIKLAQETFPLEQISLSLGTLLGETNYRRIAHHARY